MALCVCMGATMMCSFGMAPSVLNVLPTGKTICTPAGLPLATVMDNKPFVNIMPFGMCQSMANPAVASATAAALGVLTPMPCTPVIPGPWTPGCTTLMLGGKPVLHQNCKLMCAYAGVIQINNPGQATIMGK